MYLAQLHKAYTLYEIKLTLTKKSFFPKVVFPSSYHYIFLRKNIMRKIRANLLHLKQLIWLFSLKTAYEFSKILASDVTLFQCQEDIIWYDRQKYVFVLSYKIIYWDSVDKLKKVKLCSSFFSCLQLLQLLWKPIRGEGRFVNGKRERSCSKIVWHLRKFQKVTFVDTLLENLD